MFPVVPLAGGDRGLLYIIEQGLLVRPGRAPSVAEIARSCVVPEARVRAAVDRLVSNGMVVETAGLLRSTGADPFTRPWWHRPRRPPQ